MIRRLISVSAVVVALPIAVLTAPIWLTLAIVADVVGRLWRFPSLRLGLFGIVYLVHQWAAVALACWLVPVERLTGRSQLLRYRDVQLWWAASLLRWSRRLLGVDFKIEDSDISDFPAGRFVLLSRHASMVDAALPMVLVVGHADRRTHYVLKDELLWDPAIGTFGPLLGNHFVARGSRTEDDLDGIARLAANAAPNSGMVIFPEGTYSTGQARHRILRSLNRKVSAGELEPDVLEQVNRLENLLPPKPAGTVTMLTNRPDADVVILGHVGLEGVAHLRGLRHRLPLRKPVVVRWWVHPRGELPTDPEQLEDWLQDRWVELDRWVTDALGRTSLGRCQQ